MSDSRAEDEAAIQAVLADSYKAWEAGDADGMVANYTADATAIMTGSLRDSRDAIRQNMALAFERSTQGQLDLQQAAQPPLRRQGRRDRRQRIRHPVRRPDRGSGRRRKVNATWVSEAGRAVADRRLSQQPGAGDRAVVLHRQRARSAGRRTGVCRARVKNSSARNAGRQTCVGGSKRRC